MDPYLEDPSLWPGVHQRLITYISDELQSHIRPKYNARIGERLYVVEPDRDIYPDVTLIQRRQPEPALAGGTGVAVAPAIGDTPLTLIVPPVEYREPYIEIVHTGGGEVVTVIEILSPANKTQGKGYELYQRKQQEVLNSQAHLVEVDLLSQGLHTLALPGGNLTNLPPYRYLICVSRAPDRYKFELYAIPLAQRLPRCYIPLKASDPDVVLDLPAIFNRCYDNGGYVDVLDYTQPPKVPLSAEEQAWVTATINSGTIAAS
jgi:hypothetical protein